MSTACRVLLVFALVASGANDGNAQAALPRPVVRDSGGVRIIEYPSLGPEAPMTSPRAANPFESTLRSLPPAFRMDAKPYVDIGGIRDNELEELDATHPMFTAATLSDGTIVVNDRVRLKFFTSRGQFIRAVGRAGGGPGEFGQTRELCRLRGDSLLVIDINGRLTLWDGQGKHVQTYARPGSVLPGSCQPDGSVIVKDVLRSTTTAAVDQAVRLVPYRMVRPDGSVVRDLVSLASEPVSIVQPQPTVLFLGDRVLVAIARTWDIRMQDVSGRVLRVTRFGKPPIPVTDKEWQEQTQATIPRGSSPENRKRIEAFMAHKPDVYPAYSRVRVDPAGRIWVQDFWSRGSYTVLDASGLLLGRFVLPGSGMLSRKELVGVGADHVVVFDEDGDGAVHLRFHRIIPVVNTTR